MTYTPGVVQSYDIYYCDCEQPDNNGNCEQKWKTTLYFDKNACTYNGNYVILFNKSSCHECPGTSSSVTIQISSNNMCAEIDQDYGFTATIGTFSDNTYDTPCQSFVVGKLVYFLISGSIGPGYTITDIQLNTLTIRPIGGIPILVVNNGYVVGFDPSSDPNLELTVNLIGNNGLGISFNISDKLANYLISNNDLSFAIGFEAKVYLQSNKRSALQYQTLQQQQTLSSTLSITGYSVTAPPENQNFVTQNFNAINTNTGLPVNATESESTQSLESSSNTVETNENFHTSDSIKTILRTSFLILSLLIAFLEW